MGNCFCRGPGKTIIIILPFIPQTERYLAYASAFWKTTILTVAVGFTFVG